MRIFIFSFLLFSMNAIAEVSRDDAEKMIDEMVKTNMVSKEEGQKAKLRLHNMSATEWSKMNKDAEDKAKNDPEGAKLMASRFPASVRSSDAPNDLNAEQMSAINSDLEHISPYAPKKWVAPPAPQTIVEETKVAPVVVNPVVVEDVVVDPVVVEDIKVDDVTVPEEMMN